MEKLKEDAVMPLWNGGFSEEEIAEVLGITVMDVIRVKSEFWG